MKILVFSDTHGRTDKMYDIISRKKSSELVIHLGDCCSDLESVRGSFPEKAFLGVRGNCDFFRTEDYPEFRTVTLEGHTFFMSHGHMYGVKGASSFDTLAYTAVSKGAQTALFGHTHKSLYKTVGGVTLFNPGSLEEPRDLKGPSYGMITIENGKCVFEIINE